MLTTSPTTTTVLRRGEDIGVLLVVERATRGRVRRRASPLAERSSILRHAVGDRPRVLLLCYHIPGMRNYFVSVLRCLLCTLVLVHKCLLRVLSCHLSQWDGPHPTLAQGLGAP